ncbi:MAG: hypothetical protein K1X89_27275, partial [Myxococcaceae bacterium]|nr:hypothetical protein [Myxococcaceae bacterium]
GGAGGGAGGGPPGGGNGGGGGGPSCQCGTGCCAQGGPSCAVPEVLQVKNANLPDGGEGLLSIPCGASAAACSARCGLFESNECKGGQCLCGSNAACGPGLRCTPGGNCACDRFSNCDGCCSKDGSGRPVCVSRLEQANQKLCGFAGSACTTVAAVASCGCAQLAAGQCCGGTAPVDAGFPVCPSVFKRCVACDRLRSNACGPGSSSATPDDVCVCGSTGKPCAANEYCEARGGGRCVPLPSL